MTTATLPQRKSPLETLANLLVSMPLWAICLGLIVARAILLTVVGDPDLANRLGDTDDATRLVQVRELMAGAPWFDTTLARFGSPGDVLVSHWSRLVDLPLALLIGFFSLLMPVATAEIAVRALWPLLLLGALLYVMARAADARGGRIAALVALALTLFSFSAIVQFSPGRIDHHNVQNLAVFTGLVLLASALTNARHGWLAGIALGLGIAIGYESILATGACLALAALYATISRRSTEGVSRAFAAFAAATAAAFVATTAPSAWLDVRCDALSLNMVSMAAAGSAGVRLVLLRLRDRTLILRLAGLATAGAASVGVFLALEPACSAGPFGQVRLEVFPIWLDHVSETRSLSWLFGSIPASAFAYVAHICAGLAAACLVARRDRDDSAIFYGLAFAVTAALSVIQIKLMPYAALLAIPPTAIAISRITGTPELSQTTLQAAATVMLNQNTVLVICALIAGTGHPSTEKLRTSGQARQQCIRADSLAPLAGLPAGLALAEIDHGPYIVATTALDALSAPYHRIDASILAAEAILKAEPAEAEKKLRALGVTYVVTCAAMPAAHRKTSAMSENALITRLNSGKPPEFLVEVPLTGTTLNRVWRMKPL